MPFKHHPADQVRDIVYRYRLQPKPGFEYVSPSCTKLIGYTPEEHYADPDLGFKIVHPDDRSVLERLVAGDVAATSVVLRWIARDGRTLWIEQRNTPVVDDEGTVVAIAGIARDIGHRVERERELVERIEHQARLVDAVTDAVVSTDLDRVIVSWNRAATRIYGWTAAEALGQRVSELLRTELTDVERDRRLVALRTVGRWTGRATQSRKDGTRVVVDASVSLMRDASGEPTGIVAVNRDITELIRLERELQQAHRVQALGQLAGGIAHDFNNLLMGVSGAADILRWNLPEGSQLYLFADEIKRSAASGAAITRQLLDLTADRQSKSAALLDDSIQSMTRTLARLLGESITLDASYGAPGVRVALDVGAIGQILLNLAANASDAMPGGGTFAIETDLGSREAPAEEPHDHAVLTVSDDGCGMSAATLEHVFDPFFTTKQPGQGTGLGLATVYGIVQRAGGRIAVTSSPGKGATFRIHLPRAEKPHASEPKRPRDPAPADLPRVLVVEDNALVRVTVREYLQRGGYEVVDADSPSAALALWPRISDSVVLALLDLRLPGMSGLQLLSELRGSRPGLPAVFMTAHSPDQKRVEQLGATLLQKPFEAGELLAAVGAGWLED